MLCALLLVPCARAAVRLDAAWVRETAPGQTVGAGYLTIVNLSARPERLLGAFSPAAEAVQIHEMSLHDGVMRMRQLEAGIVIPSNSTVKLETGGTHLMLLRLKAPLVPGQSFPITFKFRDSGMVTTSFVVEPIGK